MAKEKSKDKTRIDQLLVSLGLAETIAKAQALLMSGSVLVDDCPVDKAGAMVPAGASVRLRGLPGRFVGRGGEKIDGALDHFGIEVEGLTAVDIGASTGGFTDCLLQRGARLVYAVDVGFNQLAPRLRIDSRVVVRERVHAMDLRPEQFDPPPQLAVVDVSFIGLSRILPAIVPVVSSPKRILALVKPQFELPAELVEKGGVVTSLEHQREAVRLVEAAAAQSGLKSRGAFASPLRGEKKGNQEYFVYLVEDLDGG